MLLLYDAFYWECWECCMMHYVQWDTLVRILTAKCHRDSWLTQCVTRVALLTCLIDHIRTSRLRHIPSKNALLSINSSSFKFHQLCRQWFCKLRDIKNSIMPFRYLRFVRTYVCRMGDGKARRQEKE